MKVMINYNEDHAAVIDPLVRSGDILFVGPGNLDVLTSLALPLDSWTLGLMLGGGPGTPLPKLSDEEQARLGPVFLDVEAAGGKYTPDDLTPRVEEVGLWCKEHNKRLWLAPSYAFAETHVETWAKVPGVNSWMFQLMRFQADPARFARMFEGLVQRVQSVRPAARFAAQVSLTRGGAAQADVETLFKTIQAARATGKLSHIAIFYSPKDKPDLEGLKALTQLAHTL